MTPHTKASDRGAGELIRLVLPFPPQANNLNANSKNGGRFRTKAYADWFTLASTKIRDSHRVGYGPYSLHIALKRPDRRRRDLGNLEKAVSDLLVAHGVVKDDCMAERITLQWDAGLSDDCVVIVQPFEGYEEVSFQ